MNFSQILFVKLEEQVIFNNCFFFICKILIPFYKLFKGPGQLTVRIKGPKGKSKTWSKIKCIII